jgi:hypothetical protein
VEGRVEKARWSHIPITFPEEDVRLQGFPHNDALVIEANIASWTLGKLLVDNGSSADIIFADAFDKMGSTEIFYNHQTHLCMVSEGVPSMHWAKWFSRYPSAQSKTPELSIYPSTCGDVLSLQWHPGQRFPQQVRGSHSPGVSLHQNPGDARGHHNLGPSK